MCKYSFFLLSVFFLQGIVSGQQNSFGKTDSADESLISHETEIFRRETSYIGDFVSNLRGGKQTGIAYLGLANIIIGFNTKDIGLWNKGEFFVNGACTHGATPTEKLIGDFQVASNIEAGNNIYIHELWYRHNFEDIQLTLGLQDLNASFVSCDNSSSFINSSFGIPSLISDNVPVPIFPLTALGIMGRFDLSNSFSLQAAVFDGLPEDFEKNPYNLNWKINNDDGALFIAEVQLATEFGRMPGSIKAGGYYHSHLTEHDEETGAAQTVFQKNNGIYFIFNQEVWQKSEKENICLFTQVAASPGSINRHSFFFGGGVHYTGLLDKDGNDELGLAFAQARFREGPVSHETTIEFFYKVPVSENLFLQPDLQYIINPANSDKILDDALAVIIRFGINF